MEPPEQSLFQEYAPLFAFLGAIFGGTGLTFFNKWLDKNKDNRDYGIRLRDELREENMQLRDENKELRDEVDETRHKYLKSLEEIERLRGGSG